MAYCTNTLLQFQLNFSTIPWSYLYLTEKVFQPKLDHLEWSDCPELLGGLIWFDLQTHGTVFTSTTELRSWLRQTSKTAWRDLLHCQLWHYLTCLAAIYAQLCTLCCCPEWLNTPHLLQFPCTRESRLVRREASCSSRKWSTSLNNVHAISLCTCTQELVWLFQT